ncbi:hypothetical protein ACIQCR_24570 [Streptomyces sp. NPDC093249]|uniref:phage tail assembly protein T n=1 Tax=unclassified Streptomyces TaxID=2593676 RepID=UPI00382E5FB4
MAELLERTSSAELTEWMAYEHVAGPLGPERLDLLHAITSATIANTARGKGQPAREPKDFMPRWDQAAGQTEQSWQQMLATVKTLNAQMRGHDRRETR